MIVYLSRPELKLLSDTELLVRATGMSSMAANTLVKEMGSIYHIAQAERTHLIACSGIGNNTAAKVEAAIELGVRALTRDQNDLIMNTPADAASLLMPAMLQEKQELLLVLALDTRHKLIGRPITVYRGSVSSCQLRGGEVFKEPILRSASAVIIVHNHPSGDPTPSPEDVSITRLLVEAGKLLDIVVLDHLIIGHGRYASLKERGLGF